MVEPPVLPASKVRAVADLAAIISDEEIARVHGHANFGSMPPRQVVNDGVRKVAVGYHCGSTQFSILRDHGLITKPRGHSYDVNLTKKGKAYGRVLYGMDQDDAARFDAMKAVAWRWRVEGVGPWITSHGPDRPLFSMYQPGEVYGLEALAVIPTQGAHQ